jgi:hypothetical protein
VSIQLNIGDHISRFNQFITIPPEYRADARWARTRAKVIASTRPGANVYFRSLSAGRSLSSLLSDRSIWVNYYVGATVSGAVFTLDGVTDIGITSLTFHQGRQHVLGTLLHELAHVAGASNDSTQAEEALVHCGLGTMAELRSGIDDPKTPYIPGHRG